MPLQTPPDTVTGQVPGKKSRKKPQTLIIGLAATVLILGGWWFFQSQTPAPVTTVETATVTLGDMTQAVAATGRVVPNFEVEIKGKASGKILRLPYDVSDYVRQGDLLVELDPIDELRQVQQYEASLSALNQRVSQSRINLQVAGQELNNEMTKARSNLNAALAHYNETQAKRGRLSSLLKQDLITQEEFEAGVTEDTQASTDLENARTRFNELQTQQLALGANRQDVGIARAEADSNRMQLLQAEQRLSETRIYSPIDGYITSRTGQIGQIVASGISNVGGGTSIMTVADLSRIFVLAAVDESDIGEVRNGEQVKITVDAFPGEVFMGEVVQVAAKGVNEADVVTFEVKVEVTSKNKSRLKPEMTTNTEIIIARKDKALMVPVEAVAVENGKRVVTLQTAPGQTRKIVVRTGISDGIHTQVLSGLKVGEKVIVHRGELNSQWRNPQQAGGNPRAGQQMMMMRGGRR